MRTSSLLAVASVMVLCCKTPLSAVQAPSTQTLPVKRATPMMRALVVLVDVVKAYEVAVRLGHRAQDREFGIGLESQTVWRNTVVSALQRAGFRTTVNRLDPYDVALEVQVLAASEHGLKTSLGGTLDPFNCEKQSVYGKCLDPAYVYTVEFGSPRTTSGLRKDDSGGWTVRTSRQQAEKLFSSLSEKCSTPEFGSYHVGSMPGEGLRYEQAAAVIVNDLVTCDAFEAFATELNTHGNAPVVAAREAPAAVEPVPQRAVVPAPPPEPVTPRPSLPPAQFVRAAPQLSSYAVVIGIERYRDVAAAVGANADAQRMSEVLRTTLGLPADHVRVAVDDRATRADIDGLLSWLVKTTPAGGRAYFYFSGHGAPDTTPGKFAPLLMPYDANQRSLAPTAVSLKQVLEALEQSKARESIVILDTCFSGAGGRSVLPYGERPILAMKPVTAASRMAVLSSSGPDEISGGGEWGDARALHQTPDRRARSWQRRPQR